MLKLSSTWWKYEQTLQRAHTTMLHFRATEPSSSINMPHIHQYIGNECQSILPLVWYHTSFNDLFPETQCLWNLVQEFPPYPFQAKPHQRPGSKRDSLAILLPNQWVRPWSKSHLPQRQWKPAKSAQEAWWTWLQVRPSNGVLAKMTGWFVVGNQATCSAWHDGSGIHTLYNIHEFAYAWTVSLDDHGLL